MRFPDKVNDEMLDVTVTVAEAVGATVPATLSDAALIEPAPLRVPVVLPEAEFGKVMEVVTVNVKPELTVSVEPFPTVIELQVLLPSTVSVNPAPMTMSSGKSVV